MPPQRRHEIDRLSGAASLLLAVLFLSGCGLGGPAEEGFSDGSSDGSKSAAVGLTGDTYDDFVAAEPLSLVMFYTDSCGICRAAQPAMARLADEAGGRYQVGLVDAAVEEGLRRGRVHSSGVPIFMFYREGKVLLEQPGAAGADPDSIYSDLKRRLDGFLSTPSGEPAAGDPEEKPEPYE